MEIIEEVIERVARLYNDMQQGQNPAWVRPTDEDIMDVLKDILVYIDIDAFNAIKKRKEELEDRLFNIRESLRTIESECDDIRWEMDQIDKV